MHWQHSGAPLLFSTTSLPSTNVQSSFPDVPGCLSGDAVAAKAQQVGSSARSAAADATGKAHGEQTTGSSSTETAASTPAAQH